MNKELHAPAAAAAPTDAEQEIARTIPIGHLVPSRYQPRTIFDPVKLAELAENVRELGIMQPILIRRLPAARLEETWSDRMPGEPAPTHEIVAGERRWRAAKLAGLKSIPYLERELTDAQVARMALAENVQRDDLHPLEEAKAYRNILDLPEDAEKPMAERIAKLAKEIGKSTRYIYQTLQLLKLADFPQQVFLERKIQRTVALEISSIGNEAQQIEACRHVAGLAKQGTEVVQHPLAHRAAAEYIASNFRLVLSKAPFPVKVEFAGVAACTTCPKMSANARELFDEGAKVPDTCMDPSCYGKKNAAHCNQLAEAAKKSGQRVITGKEAKKIMPFEDSPDYISHSSDYTPITDRRYEGKCDGKTVKQLLGADMPKPVLIQRPDGTGFVEALPKKDVERLLKEKGLLATTRTTNPNLDAEKKAKRIKAYRAALAEKLLAAVDAWGAPIVKPAGDKDANALLSKLQLQMGVRLYGALSNEGSKHLFRLMGWESMEHMRWGYREELTEKLQTMDGVAFNRYVVAALLADELQVSTWNSNPKCPEMDDLAEILGVDAKALKADMERAGREAQKAKKAPTAKKAAPAGAKKTAKPAAITSDDTKVSITMWSKLAAGDDMDVFNPGQPVRIVNADDKLSHNRLQYAGRTGTLDMKAGDAAWYVKLPVNGGPSTTSVTFHVSELMVPDGEITQLEVGLPVRFKHALKGGTHNRKCSGRAGVIAELCGNGEVMVRCEGFTELYRAKADELEAFVGDKAPAAPAPIKTKPKAAAKGSKPVKAAKKKPEQLALGDLSQPKTPLLTAMQAWPFPPVKKAEAGNTEEAAR